MRITHAPGRHAKARPPCSLPAACWSAWPPALRPATTPASERAPTPAPRASTTARTLTLWTRAPLEKQANLLVDAYNAVAREPGRAHRRPERRLRRQGRRGGRLERPARPVRRRHRLRAELGRAGPVPGHHRQHRRPAVQGRDQQGPPRGRHRSTARSTCCRSCSTCRCCSGTRTSSPRPASTPRRRRPTWRSSPSDAKAIQALNKPDTYGTATGLNCGGCLVFTWFPCVWADGEEVMNPRTAPSRCSRATRPRRSTPRGRTCGTRARCSRRRRTRPARRGPPASPRARSASCSTRPRCSRRPPFDVGVAGIPGPEGRRIDVRRR